MWVYLPLHRKLFILTVYSVTMRRLGLADVLYLSLDSLKSQPSLFFPIFFTFTLSFLIFSFTFGSFSSFSDFVDTVPELLRENFNQLLVVLIILYLLVVCGAAIVCGMTKVGIAVGTSSIGEGLREAEKSIFSIIVAFLIAGIISGILSVGGVIVVTQIVPETGIAAALLYAFVIQLSFMMGILFLYALPAITIDELDSVTAIGVSIGIVLNHLKETVMLAFLALVSLIAAFFGSLYISGVLSYLFLLASFSVVLTVLVIAVTVDYVNLK